MPILLMRHGAATDERTDLPDSARFLTDRGRLQVGRVAAVLADLGFTLDAVLSSPLTRAIQTAELVAFGLRFDGVVESTVGLAPGAPFDPIASVIAAQGGTVLVVGHMPTLPVLGGVLCGRPSLPALKPSQIAILDDSHPRALLDPDRLEMTPL